MTDKQLTAVAAKITKSLLTNYYQERADRLAMKSKSGRDLGGWSAGSVKEVVLKHLRAAFGRKS
jgi:hypothetical protein